MNDPQLVPCLAPAERGPRVAASVGNDGNREVVGQTQLSLEAFAVPLPENRDRANLTAQRPSKDFSLADLVELLRPRPGIRIEREVRGTHLADDWRGELPIATRHQRGGEELDIAHVHGVEALGPTESQRFSRNTEVGLEVPPPVIELELGTAPFVPVEAEPASVNFVYRKGERLTDVSVRVDLVRAQRQRVPELAERLTELDGVHAVVPHPIAGRLDDENAHGYAMPSLG